MPTRAQLIGERFGRLLVMKRTGSNKYGVSLWFCICDCGGSKTVDTKSLRRKDTQSCGCLAHELLVQRNTTHGKSNQPESQMFFNAYDRAKKKHLPFTITIEDIYIPKVCPVLNIPLFVSKGNPTDNSPELDRFIPLLGYVPGNIEVISRKANRIKTDATTEEVESVARYMRRKQCVVV